MKTVPEDREKCRIFFKIVPGFVQHQRHTFSVDTHQLLSYTLLKCATSSEGLQMKKATRSSDV